MPRVYSYLRFSDPKQAAGTSVARQTLIAQRWAAERGLVLDESLSMRDEGLSGYHSRHITHGALGVFLHAVENGRIEPGSVLIVEQMDRLSRAEPLRAQAQFTALIHAGIVLVTALDNKEYSLASIKANPMDLIMSLLLMIRAHEESDTKSKRVKAAIRRRCEGWQAGTWRGVIRNGRDPQWVELTADGWRLIEARAEAVRFAVAQFVDGHGGHQIVRDMAQRGLTYTDAGKLGAAHLYKTLGSRLLIGEREIYVNGETYRLTGYYPPVLQPDEFDALQLAIDRRQGKRGVGEIPSIFTGMGITTCGYCGRSIASQNLMQRKRMEDGRPFPGHRRLICTGHSNGKGCGEPGSIMSEPVERALIYYCADSMRMGELMNGGDHGQAQRAELAAARMKLADIETKLARIHAALVSDDGPTPITLLRSMRELEADADATRLAIEQTERELAHHRPATTPDMADKWLDLIGGVEALDTAARMQARELVRASFSSIVLWHNGERTRPASRPVFDLQLTARGGGQIKLRFDRASGALMA